MSELERLEDETSNTPVVEPAPEVVPTPADAAAPDATGSPGASTTKTDTFAGAGRPPALNPDGTPKKKRRRGSRGGRNRKKPGQGSGQGGQPGPRPQQTTRVSEPG